MYYTYCIVLCINTSCIIFVVILTNLLVITNYVYIYMLYTFTKLKRKIVNTSYELTTYEMSYEMMSAPVPQCAHWHYLLLSRCHLMRELCCSCKSAYILILIYVLFIAYTVYILYTYTGILLHRYLYSIYSTNL